MAGQTRDGQTPISDPGDPSTWPATSPAPSAPFRTASADGWRPEAGAGSVIGGALLLVAALVALVALRETVATPGALRIIWLLAGLAAIAAATVVANLLLQLRSLRYILGPDALIIERRGLQIAIPYHAIDNVVLRPRDRIDVAGYERYWPGYYDALVPTSEGLWRSLATTPANRRVRIHSRNHPVLAISPERPVLFVEALEGRRRMAASSRAMAFEPPTPHGVATATTAADTAPPIQEPARLPDPPRAPAEAPRQRARRFEGAALPAWFRAPEAWWVFRERIVRGDVLASNILALSLIALILLVTLTAWRADTVNGPVAVRWDAAGQPVQWVRADGFWILEGVWIFPLTAAAVIAVNAALATLAVYFQRLREARMLLATALPVELVLIAALWRATG